MRPGLVATDVKGGSKGFSAVEAPRSAVVGRVGGDKIGYWTFGVNGGNSEVEKGAHIDVRTSRQFSTKGLRWFVPRSIRRLQHHIVLVTLCQQRKQGVLRLAYWKIWISISLLLTTEYLKAEVFDKKTYEMTTPENFCPTESSLIRPKCMSRLPEQRFGSQCSRSQQAALKEGLAELVGSSWSLCEAGRRRGFLWFLEPASFL